MIKLHVSKHDFFQSQLSAAGYFRQLSMVQLHLLHQSKNTASSVEMCTGLQQHCYDTEKNRAKRS